MSGSVPGPPVPVPPVPVPLVPATPSDAAAAARWVASAEDVLVFAGPRLAYPLDPASLLEPGPDGWVAHALRDGGTTVGIGSVRRVDATTARVGRVLVDPSRRGEGWGRALMVALVEAAAALPGVRTVTLGVWRTNTGALALYRTLGFVETGVRETRVGDAVWESLEMALPV